MENQANNGNQADEAVAVKNASTPQQIPELFAEGWNKKDAQALGAVFATDADFVNVVGLWWNDRETIMDRHAYGFERIFADSFMTLIEVRVRSLGQDHAVVHALWEVTGQNTEHGQKAGARTGIFSFVAERDGEIWRAVSAQNTDRAPGMQTHVAEGGTLRTASYKNPSPKSGS